MGPPTALAPLRSPLHLAPLDNHSPSPLPCRWLPRPACLSANGPFIIVLSVNCFESASGSWVPALHCLLTPNPGVHRGHSPPSTSTPTPPLFSPYLHHPSVPFSRLPPKFQHPPVSPHSPHTPLSLHLTVPAPLLPHCLTPHHPHSKCPFSPPWGDLLHGAHATPPSSRAPPLLRCPHVLLLQGLCS